jgi:hypothetical protein
MVELAIYHGTDLSRPILDKLEISTTKAARRTEPGFRAVTTVQRPRLDRLAQEHCDHMIQQALKRLPGFGGGITMTMGRTYEVEWDGICAPI